jgi:5-methyltetrahydropteroyltriglutamate--homocysteine methyltransferase
MRRSESHILTTHAGSLPRPDDLLALNAKLAAGNQADESQHHELLRSAVADIVHRQLDLGLDVVNDGEYGKSMRTRTDYSPWIAYVMQRLTGWEPASEATPGATSTSESLKPRGFYQRRDRQAFPEVYAEIDQVLYGFRPRATGREVRVRLPTRWHGPSSRR